LRERYLHTSSCRQQRTATSKKGRKDQYTKRQMDNQPLKDKAIYNQKSKIEKKKKTSAT